MKLRKITSIAIITLTAILLTGCQDELKQQLTDCQLKNTDLQAKLESHKQALMKKDNTILNSVKMITDTLIENEKLRRENAALKMALESKPNPNTKTPTPKPTKKEMTPAEKARFKKGLENLRKMQKESAEKMRLEKLKKEGKK